MLVRHRLPIVRLVCHGLLLLTLLADVAAGATAATTRFTEKDPQGGVANVLKRIGWKLPSDATERDYDLSQESFVLRVPESVGERKPGVLAFISPGNSGDIPEPFEPLLDKHHLIWVAANKVSNKRPLWSRIALTLDGIHNVRSRYEIDEDRVYVAGVSGGGRTASFMGVCFADLIDGGLYIIGTDFYRIMPATNDPGKYWPKAYDMPPVKILSLAKKRSRHVMLNGDSDINRFQSQAIVKQMKREHFEHVDYLEAPGVGHRLPGTEWVEKALEKLDEPVADARQTKPTTREAPKPRLK